MPINIPSGLYTAGRATFDTSPMTNTILKQLASDRAAKEALMKNAQKLYATLNVAGLRQQDLINPNNPNEGILIEAKEWYNDAIRGNLNMNKYKEIQARSELSKARGEFEGEIGKLSQSNKYEGDDNDVLVKASVEKSIYDPTSRKADGTEFGMKDLSPYIQTLNPTQRNALFNSFLSGVPKEIDETKLTKTPEGYIQYTSEIKNEKIKDVSDRALPVFSTREMLKTGKDLIKDASFIATALPAFKEIYGQQAEIDSPQKALQAELILAAKTKGETITKTDKDLDFKLWKKKFDLAEAGRNKRATISAAASAGVGEPIVERYKTLSSQMDAFGSGYFPLINANAETADMIVDFAGGKIDKGKLFTKKDPDGTIRAYRKKFDGTFEDRGVVDQTSLDIKQPGGVKSTKAVVSKGEVAKTPPKQERISDYPLDVQNAIKAYMKASKLSEPDAINKLINAGKLKKVKK